MEDGRYGVYPDLVRDTNRMFDDYVPMQLACLRNYSKLIPGVGETINKLQE